MAAEGNRIRSQEVEQQRALLKGVLFTVNRDTVRSQSPVRSSASSAFSHSSGQQEGPCLEQW